MADERDVATLKEGIRSAWGGAEYSPLAKRLEPAAVGLVDACAVSAGQDVLDVAAGNGNAAAAAAREGAHVVASDLTPEMVALGRERTAAEGLDVEWVEADAEELPFEDGSFDCVVSVFGAMFAPRPELAAAQIFRVLRPGGTVGMANWGPEGFQAKFFDTVRRYRPPDPDWLPRPTLWGEEDAVRERLGGLASSIEVERRTLPWRFESFAQMADLFRRSGPQASQEMPQEKMLELVGELQAIVEEHNTAEDGSIAIDAPYTQVVARKRG